MTNLFILLLALLLLVIYAALYALARAAGGADWHIDNIDRGVMGVDFDPVDFHEQVTND